MTSKTLAATQNFKTAEPQRLCFMSSPPERATTRDTSPKEYSEHLHDDDIHVASSKRPLRRGAAALRGRIEFDEIIGVDVSHGLHAAAAAQAPAQHLRFE